MHPEFTTRDYAIGGKLVTGTATMDEDFFELMQHGDAAAKRNIKKSLISQLAEYMLENNLVEFTQSKSINPNTFHPVLVVKVRAFITPDDQVRILRTIDK